MSEVKRYHVTEAGLVEGQALGRINVVLGPDYDSAVQCFLTAAEGCVAAERRERALQQRLTAADERADVLGGCCENGATLIAAAYTATYLSEQTPHSSQQRVVVMTHKSYRLDPNVRVITDLVTDEQMQAAFNHTNFGHTDFRGLLAQGCIKALAGWHQGHTLTTILDELRLISWNKQTSKIKVTAKGRHYIWLAFKGRPGV